MKTDDLIRALASDTTALPRAGRRLLVVLPAALLVVAVALLSVLGIRPDLVAALTTPVTALKILLPLALGLAGTALALRRTQPDSTEGLARLVVFPLIAVALFVFGLSALPVRGWGPGIMGHTAAFCVPAICVASLLPLAALLHALRLGASTAPARSGLLAGLAAGGLSTAIYALHCNEDNPLFFVTWYGLAIGIVGVLGMIAGRRVLRW